MLEATCLQLHLTLGFEISVTVLMCEFLAGLGVPRAVLSFPVILLVLLVLWYLKVETLYVYSALCLPLPLAGFLLLAH